jgi:hypothetical protein
MSQIAELARVLSGKARNQDLTTAEIVVDTVRFGGLVGTLLTKTILDDLIAKVHAPMSDNQDVVAGAGLTGGGTGATTTLNVATGDASLVVNANEVHVQRSTTGAVGLAVDGIMVNVDGSTLELDTNSARVKDLGITTAKLAGNAVTDAKLSSDPTIDANRAVSTDHIKDSAVTARTIATSAIGAGLTGGGGTPISAVYTPSTQITVTAGESFLANISYLVRWAVNGETAGRIYKANAALARTQSKHLVYGILLSTTAISAGNSVTVKLTGSHTLGSGDALFNSTDIGKALYLKNDASGGYSITAPTTVDDAVFRIGVVQDTSTIAVDIKELDSIIPIPTYDEENYYIAGLAANTPITLPVNSRNGGAAQTYNFAGADLKIYVNSIYKHQGTDWSTVDNATIQFPFALPNDARVVFRMDPLASGVLVGGGGGGGGGSLQDSYDAGNTISIVSGVPVTLNGPANQKLLQINGDLGVTGIIDPIAMEFTPQVGDPFSSGQRGIWLNTSNHLMVKDGPATNINISQKISDLEAGGGATVMLKSYMNNTGSTIPAFSPVYTPSAGQIAPADGTNASKFRVIGVTMTSISPAASGNVALFGVVPGISALTHNTIIYLGLTAGSKTDIEPTLGPYPSGFYIVKLGVMEGTNLILQIEQIGVL